MDLPRTENRRSSARRGARGRPASRAKLAVVAGVLAAVAVVVPTPARGDDPPTYPVAAAEGKMISPSGAAESSPVPRTVRPGAGPRFVPPPPGFVPRGGERPVTLGFPEAVDPTNITSITKTWAPATESWDIEINWTGGTAPYTVVKSTTPSFEWGVQTVGKEILGNAHADQMMQDMILDFFFNVTDVSVISPAVEGLGYEPEPAPGPPNFSSVYAWWDSTVRLDASYLDPIAPANLSFFNRLVVKAFQAEPPGGSSYSNWVEFKVPFDARSSIPSRIQAHQRVSPGGTLPIVMRPDLSASPGFTNIRGVVWAPQPETGPVWVAADNQVAKVELFQVAPTSTAVVTDKTKPYISRVGDGGYFVVVDGSEGVATISKIDADSGSEDWFADTKDDDFQRNITPVGIALSGDGLVSYVADGDTGKVVRIPAGATLGSSTITDAWGGKEDFDFGDPAALDVNVGSQVLVFNEGDDRVWELISETTANQGPSVGPDVHVLAVDRELSTPTLARFFHTTSRGAAEAFNKKSIGSDPPAYHGSVVFADIDRMNLDLYPEDRPGQVYTIQPRDPQRVIMNTSGQNVPYTSPWQVEDRVIKFTVEGWEGLEFRLELIDPPDTAAYAPDGGWEMGRPKALPYEGNDNVESLDSGNVGLALDPNETTWSKSLNVKPGSGGESTVYLKVTDRWAGDNYQVRVKKCRPGGCDAEPPTGGVLHNRAVALSPVFTAWKRVYLERDRMFRRGGVLAADYLTEEGTCGGPGQDKCCGEPPALPCDQIKVFRWDEVSAGDFIVIFDLLESLPDYSFFFDRMFPVRLVTAVSDPDPGDGFRVVTLDEPLERNFRSSSLTDAKILGYFFMPNFENLHTAGFGVVSPGCDLASVQLNGTDSCFFEADLRGIEKPYADAFVEVFAPRSGISFLPYLPDQWFTWQALFINPLEIRPQDRFSWIWFDHHSEDPSNYRHLVGASSSTEGQLRGLATDTYFHWLFVFRGTIENLDAGHTREEMDHSTQLTTAHEFAHHFRACWCNPGEGGHHHVNEDPPVEAWCQGAGLCPPEPLASPLELCIMNRGTILTQHGQRWDPFLRFDVECLFSGDPECPAPPGSEPPTGSIRGEEDPLF